VQSFYAAGFSTKSGDDYNGISTWEVLETSSLLQNNWDHFSKVNMNSSTGAELIECNKIAYKAFNLLAQKYACGASKASLPCAVGRNEQNLKLAYAALAFSHHFLTDAFAGGHTRVPRNQDSYPCAVSITTGLLINSAHNEDNTNGVLATVGTTKVRLFGDTSLIFHLDEENIIELAMKKGISEAWNAFQKGEFGHVDDSIFPVVEADKKQMSCPLFTFNSNNKIRIRTSPSPVDGVCNFQDMSKNDCPDVPHTWKVLFDVESKMYVAVVTTKQIITHFQT
jgi:hypothetical protein